MRVVGNILHPTIKITIFEYNEKYTLKLEAGPMEQSYKITIDQIGNLGNLHKLVDEPFLKECLAHFNAMYLSWKGTVERHQGS
ncbi:MAG: hypothetical protein K9G46_11665 [Flavobacteriales bacterium]|jgi:hypothetical protein|nr:hypothetical protein [Flavobacteriales bacterium]